MMLPQKLIRAIESFGFVVMDVEEHVDDYSIEFGQYTPAGEDWWCTIWFNGSVEDFIDSVYDYWSSFDVDDETEVWIQRRGQNGVPRSIRTLLEDAEWKDEKLRALSAVLMDLKYEEE